MIDFMYLWIFDFVSLLRIVCTWAFLSIWLNKRILNPKSNLRYTARWTATWRWNNMATITFTVTLSVQSWTNLLSPARFRRIAPRKALHPGYSIETTGLDTKNQDSLISLYNQFMLVISTNCVSIYVQDVFI